MTERTHGGGGERRADGGDVWHTSTPTPRRMGGADTLAVGTRPSRFELCEQQIAYFETFGFLTLRGLFAPEIESIKVGFDEVMFRESGQILDPENPFHRATDPRFDQVTRRIIPGFIERSEKLAWLRTDHRLTSIAAALLGDDYLYAHSDGNIFNCNVSWHLDAYGAVSPHRHIKAFFYLDALRAENGALRVLPGSQHPGPYKKLLCTQLTDEPPRVPEVLGVDIQDIPAWTIDVVPGDVIVSNYQVLHASFGGRPGRRLFTINFGGSVASSQGV